MQSDDYEKKIAAQTQCPSCHKQRGTERSEERSLRLHSLLGWAVGFLALQSVGLLVPDGVDILERVELLAFDDEGSGGLQGRILPEQGPVGVAVDALPWVDGKGLSNIDHDIQGVRET